MVLNVNSEHLFTDEVPAPLAPVQLLLFPEFDDILDNGIDDEIVSNKLEQSQNFMMLSLTFCVCVALSLCISIVGAEHTKTHALPLAKIMTK